jgi:hypothetical protein
MTAILVTQRAIPHRANPDGTFDSICLDCFRTIGTEKRETDLRRREEAHVCDEDDLYLWGRPLLGGTTSTCGIERHLFGGGHRVQDVRR